jgi:asparagine synthase (glutamine-hydrolysing)
MTPDQRRAAAERLYPYMPRLHADGRDALVRALGAHCENPNDRLYSHQARFALGRFAERLLRERGVDAETVLIDEIDRLLPAFAALAPVERAQVIEYWTLLEGYLLSSQGDRMTSAHGVEGRYPFLDHELVDFAFSLPRDLKLHDGTTEKFVIKEAFADLLPPSIRQRAKQPYRAPDCRAFLSHAGGAWVADVLARDRVAASGLFDGDLVDRFITRLKGLPAAAISARDDQAFMLLLSTQLLHDQFIASPPVVAPIDFGAFCVLERVAA